MDVVDTFGCLKFHDDFALDDQTEYDLSHRYEGTSILIFGRRSAEERKRWLLYP